MAIRFDVQMVHSFYVNPQEESVVVGYNGPSIKGAELFFQNLNLPSSYPRDAPNEEKVLYLLGRELRSSGSTSAEITIDDIVGSKFADILSGHLMHRLS